MRKRQTGKVVNLEAEKRAAWEREANLFCEVMAKDDPSEEARAYYDSKLDADPEEWRRHGELTRESFDLAFKGFWLGYVTKESVRRGAELLKAELGHVDASAVERVLIEHAVLCHVRLGMVEHAYSRAAQGSYNASTVEHYERRLTLAQKRFARAVTCLTQTRALLARAEAARDAASKARSSRALAVLKQMAG